MSAKADSLKTILYALGANFAIGVAKLGAAVTTGSSAMLAEAIHSFADCGNQALLLVGMKQAKRAPSPDYPLGYGKAIYFWSFIVALMLFAVGGMFSIYEGVAQVHASRAAQAVPGSQSACWCSASPPRAVSMRACLHEIEQGARGTSLWRMVPRRRGRASWS